MTFTENTESIPLFPSSETSSPSEPLPIQSLWPDDSSNPIKSQSQTIYSQDMLTASSEAIKEESPDDFKTHIHPNPIEPTLNTPSLKEEILEIDAIPNMVTPTLPHSGDEIQEIPVEEECRSPSPLPSSDDELRFNEDYENMDTEAQIESLYELEIQTRIRKIVLKIGLEKLTPELFSSSLKKYFKVDLYQTNKRAFVNRTLDQVLEELLLTPEKLIGNGGAVKKPRSAFDYFWKDFHKNNSTKSQGKVDSKDLRKTASEVWKCMDSTSKQIYNEMSETDKQRYDLEMQQWKLKNGYSLQELEIEERSKKCKHEKKIQKEIKKNSNKEPIEPISKPKKPLSAKELYHNYLTNKLRSVNTEATMDEVVGDIDALWEELTDQQKEEYIETADLAKKKYKKEKSQWKEYMELSGKKHDKKDKKKKRKSRESNSDSEHKHSKSHKKHKKCRKHKELKRARKERRELQLLIDPLPEEELSFNVISDQANINEAIDTDSADLPKKSNLRKLVICDDE